MYAYCINNPTYYLDNEGKTAEGIQKSASLLLLLPLVDGVLPIGDIFCVVGIIVLGAVNLSSIVHDNRAQANLPNIKITTNSTPNAPQPNKNNQDDDDDNDDYYDDDKNFGGRQKIGKSKGGTPGSNKAQNKQFKDATKGLSKAKQRQIHDLITKKHFSYHDILTDLLASVIINLRSDGSSNSIAVMLDTALTSKLRISTSSGATKQGKRF